MPDGAAGCARVWGWIIVSAFTVIVGCAMGEVCSTYPSAGSVYHWTGQLAPEKWAPLISYICGWFNFLVRAGTLCATPAQSI